MVRIHGKAKFWREGRPVQVHRPGDGAEEEAMFKRSDLGLRFGVNDIQRQCQPRVDLGLLNILKDADEVKAKNGRFFVSLGYNF
ncbi:MAG: hypothetical protein ACLT1W_14595 [Alistipes onderdonkii]